MNFSIAQIINLQFAPQHKISCSWFLWWRLIRQLRQRGRNESQESGAFLLGHQQGGSPARITDFILYDDLDPQSLDTGIVRFDGRYFGALWSICRQRKVIVLADIHVHPGDSGQSLSDQTHPMISQAGHLAFILPHFARAPIKHEDIGIYRYLGDNSWQDIPRTQRRQFFWIGF